MRGLAWTASGLAPVERDQTAPCGALGEVAAANAATVASCGGVHVVCGQSLAACEASLACGCTNHGAATRMHVAPARGETAQGRTRADAGAAAVAAMAAEAAGAVSAAAACAAVQATADTGHCLHGCVQQSLAESSDATTLACGQRNGGRAGRAWAGEACAYRRPS